VALIVDQFHIHLGKYLWQIHPEHQLEWQIESNFYHGNIHQRSNKYPPNTKYRQLSKHIPGGHILRFGEYYLI